MEPTPPIPLTVKGRGAASDPPNRFQPFAFERDGDDLDAALADPEEAVAPRTVFLKDAARSVIARNDSPDVGFTHSINPYRGCEHGCAYCMDGDTPVLTGDGTTRALADLRVGDAIYGTVRRGRYRYYTRTTVLAHWATHKPAYRVTLEDGTALVASGDHRFLTERGWKYVTDAPGQRPHLTTGNKLAGVGRFARPPAKDAEYERGYLCGMVRGDGHLATYHYNRAGRTNGDQYQFRLALADEEALRRTTGYLDGFQVSTTRFVFQEAFGARRAMHGIRTHSRERVHRVGSLIDWPDAPSDSWCKGFLAGIFDAEGCYSSGILRVSNTDPAIVGCVTRCLTRYGFRFVVEAIERTGLKPIRVARMCGGLKEHLRFFHATDPAITRKRDIEGQALKCNAPLGVVAIEPLPGTRTLFDITTGTSDFIADGVVSHNCYARPTHEFLGFSAGLDFETKILVKEDAPELLRRELSAPKYEPAVLSISGVTDCYQPVERKLKLTRRCIEVLAEFRNPLGVITKNHLVTRDVDLLRELAAAGAAVVMVSVTTLDPELGRRMEPRTSSPARRLAAVELLAKAGVPVGVMVAPVVPGLTDHEVPAILKAAADAGARCAGYVPLRLPLAVAPLFADWLARHYPDRRDKVLNRIRDLRGGKLNDSHFGSRMRGQGVWAEQLKTMFDLSRRKAGLDGPFPELSTASFRRPPEKPRAGAQMSLW